MDPAPNAQVSNRVLRLNVGFLTNEGPGNSHKSELNFPTLKIADDLVVKYLRGPLRLSRTKEGILVQANLQTAIDSACFRCLDIYDHPITVELEELFYTHWSSEALFTIGDDGILDLTPLLREEIMIEADYGKPFRADKNGICRMCGIPTQDKLRINEEELIDPRLAVLKKLLDSS